MSSKYIIDKRKNKIVYNFEGSYTRDPSILAFDCDHCTIYCMNGIDGRVHQEDGPACLANNGYEFWYLNDTHYYVDEMPLSLYLSYCKWEYKKKHGK